MPSSVQCHTMHVAVSRQIAKPAALRIKQPARPLHSTDLTIFFSSTDTLVLLSSHRRLLAQGRVRTTWLYKRQSLAQTPAKSLFMPSKGIHAAKFSLTVSVQRIGLEEFACIDTTSDPLHYSACNGAFSSSSLQPTEPWLCETWRLSFKYGPRLISVRSCGLSTWLSNARSIHSIRTSILHLSRIQILAVSNLTTPPGRNTGPGNSALADGRER